MYNCVYYFEVHFSNVYLESDYLELRFSLKKYFQVGYNTPGRIYLASESDIYRGVSILIIYAGACVHWHAPVNRYGIHERLGTEAYLEDTQH